MAKHGDGAVRHHCKRPHVGSEGVDLSTVYLVTGKGARERIDGDIFWLDVAGCLVNLRVECRRFYLAAARCRTQHGVLAKKRKNVQAASDHVRKGGAEMRDDRCQADVQ